MSRIRVWMGSYYPIDGTCQYIDPSNGAYYTESELQGLVQGYIEIIPNPTGEFVLIVNEDGRSEGLPRNPRASSIMRRDIFGPALFTKRNLLP